MWQETGEKVAGLELGFSLDLRVDDDDDLTIKSGIVPALPEASRAGMVPVPARIPHMRLGLAWSRLWP